MSECREGCGACTVIGALLYVRTVPWMGLGMGMASLSCVYTFTDMASHACVHTHMQSALVSHAVLASRSLSLHAPPTDLSTHGEPSPSLSENPIEDLSRPLSEQDLTKRKYRPKKPFSITPHTGENPGCTLTTLPLDSIAINVDAALFTALSRCFDRLFPLVISVHGYDALPNAAEGTTHLRGVVLDQKGKAVADAKVSCRNKP